MATRRPKVPHLLVMPKAELVIGPFKSFLAAFLHWYLKFSEEERQDWYIVSARFWPRAAQKLDGWTELDRPRRMKCHRS